MATERERIDLINWIFIDELLVQDFFPPLFPKHFDKIDLFELMVI